MKKKHKYSGDTGYCETCKEEFIFPDAPHTRKGQKEAKATWKRRIDKVYKSIRKDLVADKGEEYVQKLERVFVNIYDENL